MNWRFLLRGTAVALGALALGLAALYLSLPRLVLSVPYGPTPQPPTIQAPQGPLPEAWVGLEARALYRGQSPALAGSAFLFSLGDGLVVAATAAHMFALDTGLEAIALSLPGEPVPLLEINKLRGEPGRPRLLGANLTGDYLLLQVEAAVPLELVLTPDDRGEPQPGERVAIFAGVGESAADRTPLEGTILKVNRDGAWAVMDDAFEPGLMSGSPIVSLHTGDVVGMALVAGEREGHTVIGMHPIGSLVEKASEATVLIPLAGYGD